MRQEKIKCSASERELFKDWYIALNQNICNIWIFLKRLESIRYLFVYLGSWKTSQMCLLWAELQAAQLPWGAQGKMPQLPPLHGTAEQHLHRLVISVSSSSFVLPQCNCLLWSFGTFLSSWARSHLTNLLFVQLFCHVEPCSRTIFKARLRHAPPKHLAVPTKIHFEKPLLKCWKCVGTVGNTN